MKNIFWIIIIVFCFSCSEEPLFGDQTRHDLWLLHEGAELPITIQGNTNSKVFIILLHGGPGGSTQDLNVGAKLFSDALEEDYAMVYYDQRNAGLARGEWDEDKLTIEQHIEDLDKVVDLMYSKYGGDIKIFLSGQSWGGYLGTSYILAQERRDKVKAWININGAIHRNLRNKHNLETIIEIGNQQIAAQVNQESWSNLVSECMVELDLNVVKYDAISEGIVNAFNTRAENLIRQDKLLAQVGNSILPELFTDSYDPLLIVINGRKGTLIDQMYAFDATIEASLPLVTIPVLSIYGKYDVVTSPFQGEYLINMISTNDDDKKMVILDRSGHSSMLNEPAEVVKEIKEWVEKYK